MRISGLCVREEELKGVIERLAMRKTSCLIIDGSSQALVFRVRAVYHQTAGFEDGN